MRLHEALCATATRLYKYLMSDYHEEFSFAVREWVLSRLLVVRRRLERPRAIQHARDISTLYGPHTLPAELLAVWNNGIDIMEQVVAEDQDPDSVRGEIVGKLTAVLARFLLHVDEHPTLTRVWTFLHAAGRILAMDVLKCASAVLRAKSTKPQALGQSRLRRVEFFFKSPDASQVLRRAFLVGLMHLDPTLEVGPAIGPLLAVCIDLLKRFGQYLAYPCKLSFFIDTLVNAKLQSSSFPQRGKHNGRPSTPTMPTFVGSKAQGRGPSVSALLHRRNRSHRR